MPAADVDDRDLRFVIGEMQAARDMLAEAYAVDPPGTSPRSHRSREGIKAAIAKVALATRQADEIVLRRGGITGDVTDEES